MPNIKRDEYELLVKKAELFDSFFEVMSKQWIDPEKLLVDSVDEYEYFDRGVRVGTNLVISNLKRMMKQAGLDLGDKFDA